MKHLHKIKPTFISIFSLNTDLFEMLQSWSKVLGTPSVNLWRNFLSVVSNTRLRYFSRIPWRHATPLPSYNVEWISGQRFTKYNIEMGDGGRGGILTLTIGDVKIVTLVGQCPKFVQDCRSNTRKSVSSGYPNTSKLLKSSAYGLVFQTTSRGLDNLMKHSSSSLIYYLQLCFMKNVK